MMVILLTAKWFPQRMYRRVGNGSLIARVLFLSVTPCRPRFLETLSVTLTAPGIIA